MARAGFFRGAPQKQVRGTSQRLTGFRKPDWIMDHDESREPLLSTLDILLSELLLEGVTVWGYRSMEEEHLHLVSITFQKCCIANVMFVAVKSLSSQS